MLPRLLITTAMVVALPLAPLPAQGPTSVRDSAVHALNRLAYGPLPGQVDAVGREGVWHWIDRQLDPDRIDNRVLDGYESDFTLLEYSRDDLSREFLAFQRQRREQQAILARGDTAEAIARSMVAQQGRRMRESADQARQLVVVRATVSNRQLEEVMVDFWTNHFNVHLAKGLDRVLLPGYIEETIRPYAMGSFDDLLQATARDPAMLFYLDNVQSVAPGSVPPNLARRLERMNRMHGSGDRRSTTQRDSLLRQIEARLPQGLNENYARELLELHTVGVDAGYSQEDVVAVARILTGWSMSRRDDVLRFQFNAWAHDREEKWVLGERFPAGRGEDEGQRLLAMLARHPATMHHVGGKLCARFVSDAPVPGCVDAAVAAWRASDGDIPTILRAIFATPEFWAPANRESKVKTPLEFTVSAVRAVAGTPGTTPGLSRVVGRLGQPLYGQPAPNGWPETQEDWVNSGALLDRMNVAMALAANALRGATVDLEAVVPLTSDIDALLDAVDDRVLAGQMSATTREVIRREVAEVPDPAARRVMAVGLAIGGPEFQRQ